MDDGAVVYRLSSGRSCDGLYESKTLVCAFWLSPPAHAAPVGVGARLRQQLFGEILDAAPEDIDIRVLEVRLEVAPRALGLQHAILLGQDLPGDMGVAFAPAAAL